MEVLALSGVDITRIAIDIPAVVTGITSETYTLKPMRVGRLLPAHHTTPQRARHPSRSRKCPFQSMCLECLGSFVPLSPHSCQLLSADQIAVSYSPITHPSFGVNASSATGDDEEQYEDEEYDEDAEIEEEINRIEDQIEG